MNEEIKQLYFLMGTDVKVVTAGDGNVSKITVTEQEARFDFAEGAEMVLDRRYVIGYSVGKPFMATFIEEPKKFNNKAMKRALKK